MIKCFKTLYRYSVFKNEFNYYRMKRKYYSWDEAMNLREVKVGTHYT